MAHKCNGTNPRPRCTNHYNSVDAARQQANYEKAWRKRQQQIALWLGSVIFAFILAVALFGLLTPEAKAEENAANLKVGQSDTLKPFRCVDVKTTPVPTPQTDKDQVVLCFLTDGKVGCTKVQ